MYDALVKRIQEFENSYRFISDNLLDAVWVIDAETLRYEYISASIEKISGYTVDEYLGMTIKENLTADSLEEVISILSYEIKNFSFGQKRIRKMELEIMSKEGSTYWVEVRAKFFREKEGPLKIVGVSKNITDRKIAEEKQDDLIKKLQSALMEKERLLDENRVLRGLLPICSGCKRIRDEHGKWWPLDAYVTKKTKTKITHTICPDCKDVYYSEF